MALVRERAAARLVTAHRVDGAEKRGERTDGPEVHELDDGRRAAETEGTLLQTDAQLGMTGNRSMSKSEALPTAAPSTSITNAIAMVGRSTSATRTSRAA
ncbi:MAG: hypothetical protein NVSMB55_26580 [Mycobacteriales bacterium]